MINFNAAQSILSAIGLPVQQNSNTTITGNNNFQELISGILNNQINSEKADVSAAISADPNTKAALFQSISMLDLLGKIQDVSKLSTGEIINEPAVNAVIMENNLNPEQAQLLAEGIKITAAEIVSGNIQTGKTRVILAQDQAMETLNVSRAGNAAGIAPDQGKAPVINVPVAFAPAAVIPAQNQDTQVVKPAMDSSAPAVQPAIIPQAVLTSNSQAVIVPEADTAAVVTNSMVKPIQAGSEPAAVIPAVSDITIKPITPSAVAPVYEPEPLPVVLNTLPGNVQAVSVSSTAAERTTAENVNKLVAGVQDIIKDFTALIYNIRGNKDGVQAKAELINNKVSALTARLDELTATAANTDSRIKIITDDAADILATVVAVLYRISQAYSNTAPASGAKDNNAAATDVLLSNSGSAASGNQENRQIPVAAGLSQESKDLISRIFGLLKKMNGELYVEKKTYFVYNPASNFSSRIAKDGSLIINTAVTSAGAPAIADNNAEIIAPVITRAAADAVQGAEIQAVSQPIQPVITEQDTIINNTAAVNNKANSVEAALSETNIVPLYRNSDNAEMLLSGIKDRNAREVDWVKGAVTAYVPGLKETENVQLPVNTKVFEKAVDFAGRVKEDIIIRQVVSNIQNTVQLAGKTEIKMFLRPENMGPVSITLDSTDKMITGRIEVANTDVKDILKTNMPVLRDALSNMGLIVTNIDVSIMSGYIGSGLPDSSSNRFAEWEGSAMRPEAEETLENAGALNGINGYLNFLA